MKFVRKCLVVLLVFFTVSLAFTWDRDSGGSQKVDFRKVRSEIREAYQRGELNRVIKLYREICCEEPEDKGRRREKKAFRKAKDEIRADIYQWVVLSYIALDQPEKAEIYLKRFLILRRGEELGDYWRSIRNAAKNKYHVAPRWLVGLKLGTNFTMVHPGVRFSVLEPAFDAAGDYDKNYGLDFTHSRGTNLGFILEYALDKKVALSIQPAFTTLKFQYENSYSWEGETEKITAKLLHNQVLDYVEIPVFLKYQLLNISSKLKAYIQIGGFYRILTSAQKLIDLETNFKDDTVGTEIEEITKTVLNIKKHTRQSNTGILAGAVLGYNIEGIRLEVHLNYKFTFNNIFKKDQRYENIELMLGYYDVFDDLKLSYWDLSVNVSIPLSFKAFRR